MRIVIVVLLAASAVEASPSKPAHVPTIECHNTALPQFRFELETPPVDRYWPMPAPYTRRIKFWDGTKLLGDSTVRLVTSRNLTRVETSNIIKSVEPSGLGFELEETDYTSMPAVKPLGFVGVVTAMGASVNVTCTRR
jgi:hypothetical protein